MRKIALLIILGSLSACSGGTVAKSGGPTVLSRPILDTASSDGFRNPQVQRESGLESVIGARAQSLLSRFGTPRIDLAEGDARKLQFASASCILDIYLYPLSEGTEPVATHIEARQRQGGTAVSKTGCMAEVERR